ICRDILTDSKVVAESKINIQTFGEFLTERYWILILIGVVAISILAILIYLCYRFPRLGSARIKRLLSKKEKVKDTSGGPKQPGQGAPPPTTPRRPYERVDYYHLDATQQNRS
ncbi:hypothetical protein PFISCL1PPCAC_28419, partial [Pristionchus fissidentatus]